MKKRTVNSRRGVDPSQAEALDRFIAALMREFKLEPGLLAGSVYADLHANDIGLFEILAEEREWSVNRIAEALHTPITTISSALDRLERRALVERKRSAADRRVVRIELTAIGQELAGRLREQHVANCAAMLARLAPAERKEFLRLAAQIARPG